MTRRLLILPLLWLCAGRPATAQKNWELKKDQDGIRVYSRPDDSSRCNDLKVETTLPAKLSSLAALVLDTDNYPNWVFSTGKTAVLKKTGPAELYFYDLINSPWPASDRDLIVRLHLLQDSLTRVLSIKAEEMANYIPEKKGIVRVPLSIERWTVTPLPGDKIRISYELRLDPGAAVPGWLINMFSTKGPFETFTRLRDQLKRPKYRDATLPFIRN
jgi:hypothetical protein